MEKIPFTSLGLETIKAELLKLKTEERPAVIKAIADAREHGDLSEKNRHQYNQNFSDLLLKGVLSFYDPTPLLHKNKEEHETKDESLPIISKVYKRSL